MGRKFTIFALFYFVFEGKYQVQASRGGFIRRGDLTEGFLRYDFEGFIFGGAYFRNFTVGFTLPLSCFGGWYFVLCLSLEKTASEKLTNSNSLGIFFR